MTDFNLLDYLGVFIDEVDEQLQILDTEILNLERAPNHMETIVKIFRAAHTLKGSSASMGFEKMKVFTHYLENVFEQIRENKIVVTNELITIIFDSIDVIRELKKAIIDNYLDQVDINEHISRLEAITLSSSYTKEDYVVSVTNENLLLDEYQTTVLRKGMELGHSVFIVTIQLEDKALMRNVRILLIHNQLKEIGEIIATHPTIEHIEQEGNFEGVLSFVLLTSRPKRDVANVLQHISDIAEFTVNPMVLPSSKEINPQINNTNTSEAEELLNNNTSTKSPIQQKTKIASTVRVDVDKLEHLMNLVGELVIDQTRLIDVKSKLTEHLIGNEDDSAKLDEVTNHIGRVISELQEGMMKTRMLPIEQLFNRFPRMVRDTSVKANKQIEFIMEGKETELDRTLIEEVSDPIIHMLRNAIDHGIETSEERIRKGKSSVGKVILKASHEENHIVITITDDGKGIDSERLKKSSIEKGIITEEEAKRLTSKDAIFLLFRSGISTANEVTELSGRGVGMDIVRSHIEKLNGIIDIHSITDEGTTFVIKLPLTLAIIRSLLIKLEEKTFALPLANVLEIIRLESNDIQMINNQEVGMVRGRVLPLIRMSERLGIETYNSRNSKLSKREFVIVIGIAEKRIGIIADKLVGNQEIVIKSLGSYIGNPQFISGATIMGDGNVALILDLSSIVRECGMETQVYEDEDNFNTISDDNQFVTFRLDDEEYGINIEHAKDIIRIPTLTKVVNMPNEMLGLINLRGNMIPVFSLKKKFELTEKERTSKSSRIIIMENGDKDIGFLVDEVTQVLKLNNDVLQKPKDQDHINRTGLIKAIYHLDERVVLILESNTLLQLFNIEI